MHQKFILFNVMQGYQLTIKLLSLVPLHSYKHYKDSAMQLICGGSQVHCAAILSMIVGPGEGCIGIALLWCSNGGSLIFCLFINYAMDLFIKLTNYAIVTFFVFPSELYLCYSLLIICFKVTDAGYLWTLTNEKHWHFPHAFFGYNLLKFSSGACW